MESAEAAVENFNGKAVLGSSNLYVGIAKVKGGQSCFGPGNIFVKNLDKNINEESLEKEFSIFGKIASKKIIKSCTGDSEGRAFVCFESVDDAIKAIAVMNNKVIGSNTISVEESSSENNLKFKIESDSSSEIESSSSESESSSEVSSCKEKKKSNHIRSELFSDAFDDLSQEEQKTLLYQLLLPQTERLYPEIGDQILKKLILIDNSELMKMFEDSTLLKIISIAFHLKSSIVLKICITPRTTSAYGSSLRVDIPYHTP
ncbi:polyadenylate-binding protein 4-like [Condylostylus longicornis]|uniref:polyadenylate-binding protein 4-like n=1 Tax=Condylostylus longicornis TaxID=2530218 RepID=UPI00244DBEF2|nr:polyadenylate-binding protein 4-like [Condylostylus longicornis]